MEPYASRTQSKLTDSASEEGLNVNETWCTGSAEVAISSNSKHEETQPVRVVESTTIYK